MASSLSHLFEASNNSSLDDQVTMARTLLSANEMYRIWNSTDYHQEERQKALEKSCQLTLSVLNELPNHSAALSLMARIEMDRLHYDTAEELLARARKIEPDNENIALNQGYLILANRRYAEAEQFFTTLLQSHPNSYRAFSGIALAKLKQGDYLGATGHYLRLLELGFDSKKIRQSLVNALEFLTSSEYSPTIEKTLLTAFSWDGIEHDKLANLTAAQLVAKYDLNNDNAILDLNDLLSDELLLNSLSRCLLKTVKIESLVVELRRAIMTEVTMTGSLRDELLPAAIAIGVYAAKSDFVLMMSHEEETEVAALAYRINDAMKSKWETDDVAGALIVMSMYEPLYSQSFSFRLLGHELADWPCGMQDLLKNTLYDLSEEHQIHYELFGIDASQLANNDVRRPRDRWDRLQTLNQTSIYQALCHELGHQVVPKRFENEHLNILLVGSGSGQRALYLARYFNNISVCGVDKEPENIAYATLKARQEGIDNVRFVHGDYHHALISEHKFDIIEFGETINQVADAQQTIEEWQLLLRSDGLMRFSFSTHRGAKNWATIHKIVSDRRLSPTIDNIRHLRYAIMQEQKSGIWSELCQDERFFTAAGCRELFFNEFNQTYDLQQVDGLLKRCGLSFIGFCDLDKCETSHFDSAARYNLLAWHVMDQDKTLFRDAYHMYCALESGS